MNSTLMKSILAMDSYNRGYDAGIKFGNLEGNNSVDTPGVVKVGNATITNVRGQQDAQDIGFYGLAYSYGGETVISYRGTNYPSQGQTTVLGVPYDVYHGWSLGAGDIDSAQGLMAVQFYQSVAGAGNWRTANISLTGHSLGGGLAGLVGGLYVS